MKKYGIGLAVAVVFVIYSLVLRHQHSSPVIAPVSLSKGNSSSGSSSSPSTGSSNSTHGPSSGGSSSSAMPTTNTAQYKDGTYTGSTANAFYGNVQVSATISGGKITTVDFLQSPNENPNSIYINQQADPYLKQEAIQSQNPNVSVVTGATYTSQAFVQSLSSALNQAKV